LNLVAQLTNMRPNLLASNDFAAVVRPTLQSVRAIAGYTRPPEVGLSCPIDAFVADHDFIMAYENAAPWSDRTTTEFAIRVFTGDHGRLSHQSFARACENPRRKNAQSPRGRLARRELTDVRQ
jgi:surfactin synthase thioesterase subunit